MLLYQLLNINIVTEYPSWFGVFCLLLGILYALVLYRKEEKLKEVSSILVRLMAVLRAVLVAVLAFLLLSPFVKTLFNKVEKPVIIIAQDNSTSILLNKDSTFYRTEYLNQLNALKEKLAKNFEVKSYNFGGELTEGNTVNYSEKTTNISNVFEELEHKFYGRNIGALILASDGIFNQGANPVFSAGIEFPVYTVALGDTAAQRDIKIGEVIHNKITFLGNQFPIEIEGVASQSKGEKTRLTVTSNGKVLHEKNIEIDRQDFRFSERVLLEADKVGVQHFKVSLSAISNEISLKNNTKDIYIEVLDGRQEILILAAAPHPDVKALKLSIESNENYKVTTSLVSEFNGKATPYSLIIMHQVNELPASLQEVLKGNSSVLYVLGNQTNVGKFNQLQTGLSITNSRNKYNEVLPSVAPNFPLFTLSENTVNWLSEMPPVVASFGNYKLNNEGHVLLNQQIGSVVTDNQLLVFVQKEGKKNGVLAAEGIWRWRLQDYLKHNTHDHFNELINKTVQFLSVKEDKSRFRVVTENMYFENEEIVFGGELYNESYELVNEPEVKITVQEKEGNVYDFVFNKTNNAYILNSGILPAGYYSYRAMVNYGGKKYTERGKFQVKQLLLETNQTVANHQLLQNIAEKYGGKLISANRLLDLSEEINSNNNIASIIYEENDIQELINLKWIFFVLLALVSLEWFLRKRNGAY